jgi:hypothetical protein
MIELSSFCSRGGAANCRGGVRGAAFGVKKNEVIWAEIDLRAGGAWHLYLTLKAEDARSKRKNLSQ